MPATAPSITPRRPTGPAGQGRRAPARPPFRDNPRLILVGIAILLAIPAGMLTLASRTTLVAPELLTEAVLYALCAADLTMLAVVLFILGAQHRQADRRAPAGGAVRAFRTKLVVLLLGMTFVPALLVLIVGSELIRTNIDRWFNTRIAEVVSTASQIAGDYYEERQVRVSDQASRLAKLLSNVDVSRADLDPIRERAAPALGDRGVQAFEVYRVAPSRSPALSHVTNVGVPA
jgi:nitrogen fixation/metabolism regulation signal transduction histidine kinase